MRTNKLNKTNRTLTTKLLTIIAIVITILLTNIITVSASTESNITLTTDTKPVGYYGYYGIVQGNGTTTNIYIKINGNWEQYKIASNYIGYECKIISFDQKITTDNYKSLRVINIIDTIDKVKTDNTIHDYMLMKQFKEYK